MQKALLAVCSFFLIHFSLFCQTTDLYINEFIADNTIEFQDENYEYPDWIELYNKGNSTIDLTGYTITDDPLETTKWIFPSVLLPSNQYLIVFASGKDLYAPPLAWTTVIDRNHEWSYIIPTASTPSEWKSVDFLDTNWKSGKSGFGYGDGDDSTVVAAGTLSIFMRKSLLLNDISAIQRAFLHMDYDDAFIAYLNGNEIARANIGISGTPVDYNALADNSDHEAKIYTGGNPDGFEILNIIDYLIEGENILAIEVHNAGESSSDLTAIPFFSLGYSSFSEMPTPSELLDLPISSLHTNFKLSRGGEFIGFYDSDGNTVDSITFGPQKTNISFGRSSEEVSELGFFNDPTPGSKNGNISFQFTAEAQFSITGGFFASSQQISLSTQNPEASIYYTLDGKVPDENSLLYQYPIIIDSTSAIRVIAMEDGKIPSEVVTQSYFIDEDINLPTVSIVTDPDHLFSDQSGIYVTGTNGIQGSCDPTIRNLNQDWERPINLEFYDKDGEMTINQGAGIKIFGGCSRTRYPQKSFSLFARREYGKGSFDYQFFPEKEIFEFESIILRSSADDQTRTMIKDAFAQSVQIEYMDIDYQAYQPAAVFVNGVYWGIHNIREKINEHYLEENFAVAPDDVNILHNNGRAAYGKARDYQSMIDFVSNNSMSDLNNYNFIKNQMDVHQYIDYQIANIYLAEVDWPGNNIKFWNTNSQSHHRWRWITFDRDQTFLPYRIETDALALATATSAPGWPNPPWSTLLFRRLLMSEEFKNAFIQLYAYHMNTTFDTPRIIDLVDDFQSSIENEIHRHIDRWGGQRDPEMNESWTAPPTFNSVAEWENNINDIKYFAEERPTHAIRHIENHFRINGMSTINIEISHEDAGYIRLYHKKLHLNGYSGLHFNEVPLNLSAIAKSGFAFSHWEITTSSGIENNENQQITFIPNGTISLSAHFTTKAISRQSPIVINEINYNSHPNFNSGDWVEIFNNSNEIIDISGWLLKDGNDENTFILPNELELGAKKFLVVCENVDTFHTIYPGVNNRIGNLDFKFNNNGEVIRLYDLDNQLIDSVHYDDKSPWPEMADGSGPTLELIDPNLQNDLAKNWKASDDLGTPGGASHTITWLEGNPHNLSSQLILHSIYPNPTSNITTISYSIIKSGNVKITVHDMMGKAVKALLDQHQEPAKYDIRLDVNNFQNGIYFYTLSVDNVFIGSKRMIVDR